MNLSKQALDWGQAIFSVFVLTGLVQIFSRYSSVVLSVNPIVFSCYSFLACAFILILIGGKGSLIKETIKSIDTWFYGFALMISYIVGMCLYAYVTSTELTMLQKVSVALTLISSWVFLSRKPDIFQLIGALIVSLGVIIVAYGIDSEDKKHVFLMSFIYGLVQSARVFLAELHRPHSKAVKMNKDPRAKARVIGFVMLIVSLIFIVGSLLLALYNDIIIQSSFKDIILI